LGLVTLPALMGNTFVIKAHAGPTPASRLLQHLGWLRTTYIYRDPRDAMLSAHEYGQRALIRGRPNAFSHLTDFQKSLDFMMDYIRIWDRWMKERKVLVARYEDLLTNYDHEVARLVGFLKLNGNHPAIQKVIDDYRPGTAEGQSGLHFYKGRIGRFRDAYSAEQQALLNQKLRPYLERMGYEV
jgi:hypothetical protein